jgi:hypothetical protein
MLMAVLDADPRTIVYGEESILTSQTDKLRLLPTSTLNERIRRLRTPLVVVKPLVESQNAPSLLNDIVNAKAVWLYRRFDSVAVSNLRKFGGRNGFSDLELLLSNDPTNWRGEVVPDETRERLNAFLSKPVSELDAAALFWWARNMLFFQLGLDHRDDVNPIAYERLVARPRETLASIYRFMDASEPRADVTKQVHADAGTRGVKVAISSDIARLCQDLYEDLLAASEVRRNTW